MITNVLSFLIATLFDFYIIALILRVIMQWSGAHYFNPISQFIVKLTNPVVIPVRNFIPSWYGIDFATLLIALVLEIIKFYLLSTISIGGFANPLGIAILGLADMLSISLHIYIFAIIIMVILSWVGPVQNQSFVEIIYLISEPLLRLVRRFLPIVSGFDLSPLVMIIVLKLIDLTLVSMLSQIGNSLL